MKHVLFQVLSLVAIILVHTTRSDVRSYPDKYDDLLWAFAANKVAEDEVLNEDVKRTDVPKKLDIRMPNVSPQKPDSYICTAVKMPEDDGYIVGYEPHAKMQTAHHMLMFGCDKAVEMDSGDYWRCGEMVGTCQGSVNKIMYAWAKDAKALTLPKDVGFHVGGKSNIKYIVLQVHYANVDKFIRDHVTDQSGVTLHLSSKRPKYFAGIYLVAAGGPPIPSKQEVFDMNMACLYSSGPTMHPFAFRVHTHTLGYVVTGYRVRDGKWNLIGKGDPRRPQAFYHVGSEKPLQAGDILAARCTYNSMKRDRTTYIGATGAAEMCNFYLMYYYDPAEGDSSDSCSSVTVSSSDYPADTDVPLDPAKKTTSKRHMEDADEILLNTEYEGDWN